MAATVMTVMYNPTRTIVTIIATHNYRTIVIDFSYRITAINRALNHYYTSWFAIYGSAIITGTTNIDTNMATYLCLGGAKTHQGYYKCC
ncbi:hypothetical protein GCM10011425_23850 [Mucilaginibacter galii]|uniref:Uncharacterized protein n=1 Tax=Mucilaginibacter galii TaxID=2005073 RepID=A0A917J8Y3_9SPHI|nr:hypothetical protein GCM10011425_23850 [Mucilaginibacter galii]